MLHIKFESVDSTDFISYNSIISLYYFNVLVAFITVLIYNYNSKNYVILCNRCIDLNNRMRNVGLNVNFKYSFHLVNVHLAIFIILVMIAIYMGYYVEIGALLYPYGIRMSILIFCCANYNFLGTQFVLLKQYSKSNNTKFQEPNAIDYYYSDVILNNLNDFYADLIDISKVVTKLYEHTIVLNLCANTIEIVVSVILLYIKGINGLILTTCTMYALGNIIYFQLYYHADYTTKKVSGQYCFQTYGSYCFFFK